MNNLRLIEIVGAGPAGLAAGMAIKKFGGNALIYERRKEVGMRFHGDFQGIENWTTDVDALEELRALGLRTDFEYTPFDEVTCFGPDGVAKQFRSKKPLFYLVKRGRGKGTLDGALKNQSLATGVEINFEATLKQLHNGGIVTIGRHRADAIAVGYLFDTTMTDGAYAAVSDRLAAKGYAYLLVCRGQGTIATCLFDDFHNERLYLQRTLEFFSDNVGLRMTNPRRFGGAGNFSLPKTARKGNILYAGEAAGFQDPLFGFGIRSALLTGLQAGSALASNQPALYEDYWKRRMQPFFQAATTNRWFYNRLGDRGYQAAMNRYPAGRDVREFLHRAYAPRIWKRAWYYLIGKDRKPSVLTLREGCTCTWCKSMGGRFP